MYILPTLLQTYTVVAGVNPLVGLWTTVVLGFFAALFGGRAGICSSASGACAVVGKFLCMNDYVFYAHILYTLFLLFFCIQLLDFVHHMDQDI